MTPSQVHLHNYLVMMAQVQRENLERHGHGQWAAGGLEDLMLKFGRFHEGSGERPEGLKKGPNRECFANAYSVAARHPVEDDSRPSYVYCEGVAVPANIAFPVHHAWVCGPQGVVETTWQKPGLAYFGVALDMHYVNLRLLDTCYYSVFGEWHLGDAIKILEHGLPPEALA